MPQIPMRLVDGVLMPLSEDDLIQWQADQEAAPVVVLPALTARQLRLGLLALGVTGAQVDAAIVGIPDEEAREAARIEWQYSSLYDRAHPLVGMIGEALELTPEQIDAAWIAAAAR